ncbi:MAG: response regulator transcription factor [Aggregatilineales bacterium]
MPTILLIDDDQRLTGPVERQLSALGFRASVAHDGPTGLRLALLEKPDVIVLDLMLPGMDGWAVCRAIREFSQTPIIMLTALDSEEDRVRGLELGADDYLGKPFAFSELVARVRSMLRRVQWDQDAAPDAEVTIGDVLLKRDARRVFKAGTELILRNKEYELLTLLIQNAGKVIDRELIFNQVWGTDWLGDTRTLDVHIRWLRQKLEDDPSAPRYIQTVRGVGYRFATPDEVAKKGNL